MSLALHAWRRVRAEPSAVIGGAIVATIAAAALLAPVLAPYDPNAMPDPVGMQHLAPRTAHLLGTDAYSRDIFSRLLFGARISLAVGVLAASLAVLLGGAVGLLAGLSGPVVDGVLMRAVDVLLALPRLFLLMAVFALWEGLPLPGVILLIGATGWFATSRLVRAHVRALRTMDFVVAAQALGGGGLRVARHLLPHVAATVIVSATLDVGAIMLLEAGLSFLGLGLMPPTATWGSMILEGKAALFTAPWEIIAPGAALVITAVGFNLLGDGLRDALAPRHR